MSETYDYDRKEITNKSFTSPDEESPGGYSQALKQEAGQCGRT
jgi:hypothetical protein